MCFISELCHLLVDSSQGRLDHKITKAIAWDHHFFLEPLLSPKKIYVCVILSKAFHVLII